MHFIMSLPTPARVPCTCMARARAERRKQLSTRGRLIASVAKARGKRFSKRPLRNPARRNLRGYDRMLLRSRNRVKMRRSRALRAVKSQMENPSRTNLACATCAWAPHCRCSLHRYAARLDDLMHSNTFRHRDSNPGRSGEGRVS